MRILMTADTVGGVWTYSMDLARALQPHGVQIDLATMGAAPTPQQRDEVATRPNVRLHDSRYKLEWMDDPWQDVARAGVWLLQLEEFTRPDIVHLNGYVHACLPWRAPCVVVGHSCVLSWWQAVKREPAPASWQHYTHEVKRGLHAADRVIAPTQAMLDQLQHYYGPLPASHVISNGRATAMFRPAAKQPYIFAAGRLWDEAKNIATLAAAAAHVSWRVCVAGDDRHPDGHQSPLDGVQLLGHLAPRDVAKRLASASIYALPARYEPFGLSALEAALAGCALVLGDIPSLREVWGDAAIYVPPDDADALAWQLNRLISNTSLRSDLTMRASLRARQYDPARMAAAYYLTYEDLVTAGQHR
jgi:glycosyltransferase involved in cell wall biosynthesis